MTLQLESLTSQAENELLAREVPASLLAMRGDLTGHPEHLKLVLRAVGLSALEPFMNEFNPSALAPYHGFIHIAAVTVAVYEGAVLYGLSSRDMVNLVAAAALHDYDHMGETNRTVAVPDSFNISAAIAGMYKIANSCEFDKSVVERLIRSTEYPYKATPVDLLEAILRDADLTMPLLSDELALKLFIGLQTEFRANYALLAKLEERTAFGESIRAFYTEAPINTMWGQYLRKDDKFKNRVNRVIELLQENI